ncbi:Serine phosphatase RsbU, regulator of sigma subunit [Pimelobacter simplex]|uniref:Serine phosphatase RsbU, regulator of sigma subunit n=1 Tax=Nocardioides simplex TaxID=2045 RepID=A0A0A1DMD3_NOCSI|nr:Serine phosphatase RsbU, regulator of sigma subunit [Pimelobacter simplex]
MEPAAEVGGDPVTGDVLVALRLDPLAEHGRAALDRPVVAAAAQRLGARGLPGGPPLGHTAEGEVADDGAVEVGRRVDADLEAGVDVAARRALDHGRVGGEVGAPREQRHRLDVDPHDGADQADLAHRAHVEARLLVADVLEPPGLGRRVVGTVGAVLVELGLARVARHGVDGDEDVVLLDPGDLVGEARVGREARSVGEPEDDVLGLGQRHRQPLALLLRDADALGALRPAHVAAEDVAVARGDRAARAALGGQVAGPLLGHLGQVAGVGARVAGVAAGQGRVGARGHARRGRRRARGRRRLVPSAAARQHRRREDGGAGERGAAQGGHALDLLVARHGRDDALDRLGDRDAVVLAPVAVAEADRALLDVLTAGDEHEGDLLQLRVADLLLEPVVGLVDLDPDAPLLELVGDLVQVVGEGVRDRDPDHLHRREPRREGTRVVLDEDAEEALDRAELGGVDHHRLLLGAVGRGVLEAEARGLVEVVLDGAHLPRPADGVLGLDRDLGAVEGGAARVRDQLEAGLGSDVLEHLGRGRPVLVGADELVGLGVVAGRQLEVEVVETEVLEDAEHERQQVLDLGRRLLRGAVGVGVVLGEAAHPGQAVDDAGLLVAVDGAELEQAQRQLAVGAPAAAEDQVVHRAVHRLELVVRALELHRREHRVGVVRQVPRGVEQAVLGDVRRADVGEALLDVPLADVVLHLALDHATLGVEHRQPGPDLVGEAEQVELAAQLAVVTALGLLEPVQVLVERLLARPGGAVDALELLVLLVAAPVGRGAAHQLERRDPLGGGQVRPPAEVLPGHLALAVDVVVDGQLAGADLGARTLGRIGGVALEADQLDLVGLVGQLDEGVLVGGDPAVEALVLLDDLAHRGLELDQVLGDERGRHVEVVVEAVLDRRADAELGVGEDLLHGLRQHVGGRVPQDVEAVGAVDGDPLDLVAVGELVGQVLELARDPCGDDVGVVPEQLPGLGARRDGRLLARIGGQYDDLDVGHGGAPLAQ